MDSAPNRSGNKPDVVDFSFQDFLKLCLSKWIWFVVSLVICVGIGVLYICRQQPVYERSEEILITDQDAGGGVGEISGAFATMGIFANNTSVNNELISLKSPAIMVEVAKRLNLYMNYSTREGIRAKTLYGNNLIVKVDFLDLSEQQSGGFKMELHPNGDAILNKFYAYRSGKKEKYSEEIKVAKGTEIVKTPIGRIKIAPNPDYKGEPLEDVLKINVGKMALQATVELYGGRLNGDLVDQDADVIGLSIKDVCIQRAVEILNTVLVVYNENWIEDKNRMAIATSAFIDERLKVIQEELGDVDSAIAQYNKETGTPSVWSSAKISLEKSPELEANVVLLTNELTIANYMRKFIKDSKNEMTIIPVNIGVTDSRIESQILNFNETLIARNNLVANSSESNPLVENYNLSLDEQKKSIMQGMDNYVSSLETKLSSAKKELSKNSDELRTTSVKGLPLLSEERQQKVKESLYLFLLQKREENELTQTFTANNTRVITPPMGSLEPVAPRVQLILIVSILLGLAIPFGIMYTREASNTKVRSRKDLEVIKMPFAGEIPQVGKRKKLTIDDGKSGNKKSKKEEAPISVVEEGKRDVVNEAFRVIRSNIEFMSGKETSGQVIMLTSFNPGSGKSFISYNLGVSFALKRKRVLIVDCDLRHGSSSMFVGMPKNGLTNYLTGNIDNWKDVVEKTSASPNLSILPIGKMPPNPAELLDNGRIKELINEAKEDYDYVLLDCPPVNIVVDTQIVGQYADRTLFVVRAGLLDKSALGELDEFYEEKRFKNMSVILNGTEASHSRYYTYGTYQNHVN